MTHSLTSLRDRLDLEIIQLIVMADDLLDCEESGINRAVADAYAADLGAVLDELDVSGCCDNRLTEPAKPRKR